MKWCSKSSKHCNSCSRVFFLKLAMKWNDSWIHSQLIKLPLRNAKPEARGDFNIHSNPKMLKLNTFKPKWVNAKVQDGKNYRKEANPLISLPKFGTQNHEIWLCAEVIIGKWRKTVNTAMIYHGNCPLPMPNIAVWSSPPVQPPLPLDKMKQIPQIHSLQKR